MARPELTLTQVAQLPDGFDITAATGGGGEFNGFTGADWAGGFSALMKYDGGHQLALDAFGGGVAIAGSFGWGRAFVFSDRDGGEDGVVSGSWSTGHNLHASLGGGVFYSLPADQALKKFHWAGNSSAVDNQSGHWVMTATMSDGSSPPVSLVIPDYQVTAYGNHFVLAFRAREANSTLDVRFTKQTSIDSSLGFFASYLELPIPPARPRGFLMGLL